MTASVVVVSIARGVLGATLMLSAWHKAKKLDAARASFRRLGFRSDLAPTMVAIEALTGLGLVVERRTAWAAYVAAGLMMVLTAFIARQVVRGDDTPCACFGAATAAAPTTVTTLARNFGLLAIAILATGSTRTAGESWKPLLVVLGAAAITTGVVATRRTPA